jgi:RNA polymerase sigma-70 factor (ECF subfamily)
MRDGFSSDEEKQRFAALLHDHRRIVFKVAAMFCRDPHDRADLAQDISTQLWLGFPRYDAARPFSTWMYRIALNVAISRVRSEIRREPTVPLDDAAHVAAAAVDADGERQRALLQAGIAALDPFDRALMLLWLDERSTREIADIMGLGESNVTTRINRLKQRLRARLAP